MRIVFNKNNIKCFYMEEPLDSSCEFNDLSLRALTAHEKLDKSFKSFSSKTKICKKIEKVHCSNYLARIKKNDAHIWSRIGSQETSKCNLAPYSSNCEYNSAINSACIALSGATHVMHGHNTFALTAHPGHLAGYDYSKGHCLINNAVIAAEEFLDQGYSVGILDFDLHHGQGTQNLIYNKNIKFSSLHESPSKKNSYINDTGFSTENNTQILNLPLDDNISAKTYIKALEKGLDFLSNQDILVISSGFNISQNEGHSRFLIDNKIYSEIGKSLSKTDQKKLILLEKGFYNYSSLANDIYNFTTELSQLNTKKEIGISIIYHSESGNTEQMAKLIENGCISIEKIKTKVMPIENIDLSFISSSSVIVFGAPTYYGAMSWQMKKFLDNFENNNISLEGKIGACFSSANWMGGGSELAISSMHDAMLCYGMLIYSGGVYRGLPYNHIGVVSKREPSGYDAKKCFLFGKDIAIKSKELFCLRNC